MTNFRYPAVVIDDFWISEKLSHTLGGLYIWEFITHLDYEWSVFRGHRPYRWTIWIYSATRLATLMAVIIDFVILDMTTPTNCQVWTTFQFTFGYMTYSLSSFLIILRIIAIWNNNKVIVAFSVAIWATTAAFFIQGTTKIRSEWVPLGPIFSCSPPNVKSNRLMIVAMLVNDIILLLIMLLGLFRLRRGRFDLGRLLWRQGVIYLFIATAVEVPPVVFIFLDLNDAFNLMFLMPSLVTMSIVATRIYRSLADFVHSTDIQVLGNPRRSFIFSTNANWATALPVPPNRTKASVLSSYEHWKPSASQTTDPHLTVNGVDELLHEKPQGPNSDNDPESNAGK